MTIRVAQLATQSAFDEALRRAAASFGEAFQQSGPDGADLVLVGPGQPHPAAVAALIRHNDNHPVILFVYAPENARDFQAELMTSVNLPVSVEAVAATDDVEDAVARCVRRAIRRRRSSRHARMRGPPPNLAPSRLPILELPPLDEGQDAVLRDPDELRQALQQAEEAAGMGSWGLDLRTSTWTFSPHLPAMIGLEGQGFSLDALRDATHPDDRDEVQHAIHRLRLGQPMQCRFRLHEQERPLELRGEAIVDEAGIATRLHGTISLSRPPAARSSEAVAEATFRAAESEKLQAFKNQFLMTLAHELNTPLTPIRLQLYIGQKLASQFGNTQLDGVFGVLDRNIKRMENLVARLLTGVRIQNRQLRILREPVDVLELVADAIAELDGPANRASVTIDFHAEPGQYVVPADAKRLKDVVVAILENAIHFSPAGGPVDVRLLRPAGRVILEVKDAGIGLTTSALGQLFQPFCRVHDPSKADPDGAGLGLFIARGIVLAHGGHLEAASDGLGKGALFRVTLPVRAGAP